MKEWSRGLCGLLRRVLDEIVACIMYRQHSLYVRESDGTINVSFRVIVVLNRESMYSIKLEEPVLGVCVFRGDGAEA